MIYPGIPMAAKNQGGFTLLELSVVLIIVALVTTVGVSSGISALESAKRAQSESKLNVIENALMTFRMQNNRLPCPANLVLVKGNTSYGTETSNPGTCSGSNFGTAGSVVEGGVPTKALNIPEDFMYDGWGRRIAYAVDSNATEIDAFSAISIPESCGITVKDAAGSTRSAGAVYALVSFGSDGHGGFLSNGSRMKTGSINRDVLTNCHCDSDANSSSYSPTFIQKEIFENPSLSTASFTQMVRYKDRWQMITDDDQNRFATGGNYRGPNIAVGFDMPAASSNSTYAYKLQCGRIVKADDISPAATENSTGVVFTSDNRYLISFSASGCLMYPIIEGVIQTGSATAIPSCPAYDPSVRVATSSNGFLAMIAPTAPYVFTWQKSGSSFVPLITPSPPPGVPQQFVALSANYMLVSDGTTLDMYGRSSNSYTILASQPASVPGSIFSATISPNENYIAVTVDGNISATPAPIVRIWEIDTGPTFNVKPDITITSNDTPYALTFSPDGRYFALGGTSGDNVMIYRIDGASTFTRLNKPTNWTNSSDTAGLSFAFSRDSRYLVMGTASSVKPIVVFRQVSAQEYKLLGSPTEIQSYPAISVGFNN
jgi:prepilin-type N-terminal cleavage/methylation domain-containing protein